MFMFHEDKSFDPTRYRNGWRAKYTPTAGEVAKIITTYVSSNCVWSAGVRLKSNFRIADWLGLDFDDGMTLDEAGERFKDYIHVIGTTRSHRKEKKGVTCDRFRVFLKFKETCRSKDDFELTTKIWVNKTKADRACTDAARFFYPCTEIISSKYHGKIVDVIDSAEYVRLREEKIKARNSKLNKYYSENRAIPGFVASLLRHGCSGSRNKSAYMVARDLYKIGYSQNEIVDLIMNSAIPGSKTDAFTSKECLATVQSACR